MDALTGTTALVTGASGGFGRAITAALLAAGADVVAVTRRAEVLARRLPQHDRVTVEEADVTDPVAAGILLARHRPATVVLAAGATPLMRPLQHHTWQTFARPWEVDARQAFTWVREALLLPLPKGATVIALSSGAALAGSPLSGGYAAAKAAVRFCTDYAAAESDRLGLGLRFVSLLPRLTPATPLGEAAVAAYAEQAGTSTEEYLAGFGPLLAPEQVGAAVTGLAAAPDPAGAYRLTAEGLARLP